MIKDLITALTGTRWWAARELLSRMRSGGHTPDPTSPETTPNHEAAYPKIDQALTRVNTQYLGIREKTAYSVGCCPGPGFGSLYLGGGNLIPGTGYGLGYFVARLFLG